MQERLITPLQFEKRIINGTSSERGQHWKETASLSVCIEWMCHIDKARSLYGWSVLGRCSAWLQLAGALLAPSGAHFREMYQIDLCSVGQ